MCADVFRSFTHPVTNFGELNVADARSQLSGLLTPELPDSTWPVFVHELTHHWCFNTPVGMALTHLYFRPALLRNAGVTSGGAADPRETDKVRYSAGLDFIAYDTAWGLLWPVIEGLALFAEFDVIPYVDGEVYSPPLHWTLSLYARRLLRPDGAGHRATGGPLSAARLDEALLEYLLHRRTSQRLVKRKTALLAQPLLTAREGYLAGYLLIKNLWITLAMRDERLSCADVFLLFAQHYFFADLGLVARLLEPDDGRNERWVMVADHIAGSLNRLAAMTATELRSLVDFVLTVPTAAVGQVYASWRSAEQQRAPLAALPTHGDHQLWRRGIDCLLDESAALVDLADHDDFGAFGTELMWLMTQRDSFCVVHEPVRIEVTAARRLLALLHGSVLYSAPAVDDFDMPVGTYDGTVSGYLLPNLGATFVTMAINGKVGAIALSRELPEPFDTQLLGYRMDGPAMLGRLEELRESAREYVRGDSVIEVLLDAGADSVAAWQRRIAVEHALPHLESARRADVSTLLNEAGFGGLVESSARLRGLAMVSLLASLPLTRESSAALFAGSRQRHRCPDDYDAVVAFVRARGRAVLNDPLLEDCGQGMRSVV